MWNMLGKVHGAIDARCPVYQPHGIICTIFHSRLQLLSSSADILYAISLACYRLSALEEPCSNPCSPGSSSSEGVLAPHDVQTAPQQLVHDRAGVPFPGCFPPHHALVDHSLPAWVLQRKADGYWELIVKH